MKKEYTGYEKEYIDFDKIKQILKHKGWNIAEDEDNPAFYFKTGELVVAVFDNDYPNTNRCSTVKAEFDDLFDKWSSVYYTAELPTTEFALEVILMDLRYINDSKNMVKHVKTSTKFGHFERTF